MKRFRGLFIVIILLCIGAGYYVYLMNKDRPTPSENVVVQEVDRLTSLDLERNYPKTPYDVVEFYSNIMLTYYKIETDDETVQKLAAQSRNLFDEELLLLNPEETFFTATADAVTEFNDEKMRITLFTMGEEEDVKYSVVNNRECAMLTVKFYLRINNTDSSTTYQDFILRKDDQGRWKILGWQVSQSAYQDSEESS